MYKTIKYFTKIVEETWEEVISDDCFTFLKIAFKFDKDIISFIFSKHFFNT